MHIRPRVIPVLLLDEERLVKTKNFADPIYVGDPVNVISIFNDLEVDELLLLDIHGSRTRGDIPIDYLKHLATEAFVPMGFGGGIRTLQDAGEIIAAGFEKLSFNTLLFDEPEIVAKAVERFGAQAVIGSLDVRQTPSGYEVVSNSGNKNQGMTVDDWCALARQVGVGEVLVTNIDREGTRTGIDLDIVSAVSGQMSVPVIAHGGAGSRTDLVRPVVEAGASAVAAGSLFVMQGARESILVNYPSRSELEKLFERVQTGDAGEEFVGVAARTIQSSAGGRAEDRDMCVRCLITSDVPGADFDSNGICYYCHLHDSLDTQYPIGPESLKELAKWAERVKKAGAGKNYDVIMGVSGGTDSSYLAHVLVGLGVRPLAVHFDNTWNSPVATSNIFAVLDKLGIELETYVVDNAEYDDIYRSFMLSGVKDIEAPTDIGFMGVLYRAAEKHGIRFIVEGHSFRTEGISPMGWLYMDGGYVKSVHKLFGRLPMKTYPNLDFWKFVKWSAFSRIERARPLYWIDYNKEDAKKFLASEFGWQWYGGHHLENRFTAFYHTYFLPTRFGINFRQIELSALVRSGQLDREEGRNQLAAPRTADPELIALVKKRLGFDDAEFDRLMTMPAKTYRDYPTYKKRFELLRPFFWLMWKANRVPKSFYIKFCRPQPAA